MSETREEKTKTLYGVTCFCGFHHEVCEHFYASATGGEPVVADDLRAAVEAETERCAVLAENGKDAHMLPTPSIQREKFYQKHIRSAWAQCGNRIATAIRQSSSTGKEMSDADS